MKPPQIEVGLVNIIFWWIWSWIFYAKVSTRPCQRPNDGAKTSCCYIGTQLYRLS